MESHILVGLKKPGMVRLFLPEVIMHSSFAPQCCATAFIKLENRQDFFLLIPIPCYPIAVSLRSYSRLNRFD
jgi:hypothetical protein